MSISRLSQGLRKMSPGTLGGQSRAATPVNRLGLTRAVVLLPDLAPLAPDWVEANGSILDGDQAILIAGLTAWGTEGDAIVWFLAFTNVTTTFVSAGQVTGAGLQPGTLTEVATVHVDGMTLMVLTGTRLADLSGLRVVVNQAATTSAAFASVFGRFDAGTVAETLSTVLAGTSDGATLPTRAVQALAVLGTQDTTVDLGAGETDVATLIEVSGTGGDLALQVVGYRGATTPFTAADAISLRYAYAVTVT